LAFSGSTLPHAAHPRGSAAPQSWQNLAEGWLSWWHCAQRM
jgi:hypothetical protein